MEYNCSKKKSAVQSIKRYIYRSFNFQLFAPSDDLKTIAFALCNIFSDARISNEVDEEVRRKVLLCWFFLVKLLFKMNVSVSVTSTAHLGQ